MNRNFNYYKVHFNPHLYVVRPTAVRLGEDRFIHSAWTFAYTALWNGVNFSTAEVATAKGQVIELLTDAGNNENAFLAFCERVLLARKYVNAYSRRFIPLPSVWLNRENATGYAGTKKWYDGICSARRSVPSYRVEIRVLAQAVSAYGTSPVLRSYQTLRQELINQADRDLLTVFQLYVLNFEKG